MKNSESLEKICGFGFGKRLLDDLGRMCVVILKKGYTADSTLTAFETNGFLLTRGAGFDSDDPAAGFAFSLLSRKNLIKPHHAGGYTITETGKNIVDKYFRTEGEYFGVFDRITRFRTEHSKEKE